MSESQRFSIPIPSGYRIFYGDMEVAGTGYRKDVIARLFRSKQINFDIEADPDNKHDPNSIKVIVIKK